jgi:hypothetical protein
MIMDYYAFLDSNNVVTEVIPGKDQGSENTDWEQWYGEFRGQVCKRSRMDGFRKNYAGIGFTYDATRDAFIPPQLFQSWTLNETTCLWESSVPRPADGQLYNWDEATTSWVVNV